MDLGGDFEEQEESEPVAVNIPAERLADTARSGLYALFAQLFAFPTADVIRLLASGAWLDQCRELAGQLPYALATIDSASTHEERDISLTFSRLFDVVQGLPAVSLLERRYGEKKNQQQLWEDLLRYYNHFGLEFAESAAEGGPDHLVNQLEFMHYLSFLQCGSGDSGGDFRRAQRDFLLGHLSLWVSEFARSAAAQDQATPYDQIAEILASMVVADLAYLQEQCGD